MAADTIVLDNSDLSNRTFTEVTSPIAGVREFRDVTNGSIKEPIFIRVQRTPGKMTSSGVDRLRYTFGVVDQDSVSGEYKQLTASLEFIIPHAGDFTSTHLKNIFEWISNYLHASTNANAATIFAGGIPTGSFAT